MNSYAPFGWPSRSSARFATTSLAFMLTDVPAPPWNTQDGNWSMQRPSTRISSHAPTIASATFSSRTPISRLASAAAFFTMTMPRTKSGMSLIVADAIGKFSTARTVWTP